MYLATLGTVLPKGLDDVLKTFPQEILSLFPELSEYRTNVGRMDESPKLRDMYLYISLEIWPTTVPGPMRAEGSCPLSQQPPLPRDGAEGLEHDLEGDPRALGDGP